MKKENKKWVLLLVIVLGLALVLVVATSQSGGETSDSGGETSDSESDVDNDPFKKCIDDALKDAESCLLAGIKDANECKTESEAAITACNAFQ